MLERTSALGGYTLSSLDGEIGRVKDFLFDDRHWTIRYLVAETGGWLSDRQVLISPYALSSVRPASHQISVGLSKKKIEDSPALGSDEPVSGQFESSYFGYFGWPMYWSGPDQWGAYPYIARDREQWNKPSPAHKQWDPHLRSTRTVTGYHVAASDGEIGHVEDFLVDDETWAIRYLVIDTRNWWPGRRVVVAPKWIDRVNWQDATVVTSLSRDAIKESPEFTADSPLTREYEERLHRHYRRQGYWDVESTPATQHPGG
jgi:hypothetical protein